MGRVRLQQYVLASETSKWRLGGAKSSRGQTRKGNGDFELNFQDGVESRKDSRPQPKPCAQAAGLAGKGNTKCSTDRSRTLGRPYGLTRLGRKGIATASVGTFHSVNRGGGILLSSGGPYQTWGGVTVAGGPRI